MCFTTCKIAQKQIYIQINKYLDTQIEGQIGKEGLHWKLRNTIVIKCPCYFKYSQYHSVPYLISFLYQHYTVIKIQEGQTIFRSFTMTLNNAGMKVKVYKQNTAEIQIILVGNRGTKKHDKGGSTDMTNIVILLTFNNVLKRSHYLVEFSFFSDWTFPSCFLPPFGEH